MLPFSAKTRGTLQALAARPVAVRFDQRDAVLEFVVDGKLIRMQMHVEDALCVVSCSTRVPALVFPARFTADRRGRSDLFSRHFPDRDEHYFVGDVFLAVAGGSRGRSAR